MNDMAELIPEFVEESVEHLKNIEEDIILIEQGSADKELINRVFRAVHSIKGGSSFLGLKNIEHLSHKMEDIFNMVRNGDMEFDSSASSVVLEAIDRLKLLLENVNGSDSIDVNANLEELGRVIREKSGELEPKVKKLKAVSEKVAVDEYRLNTYRRKGFHVYLVKMELVESGQYHNPLEFIREIEKTGEIIELHVDMELLLRDEGFSGDGIPLRLLYATVLEKDLLAYSLGAEEDKIEEIKLPEEAQTTNDVSEAAGEPEAGEPTDAVLEELDEDEDDEILKELNEYLTFTVGEEEYGITIQLIQEIITVPAITHVPDCPAFMKGVINLRGDIIPVYDFRRRLSFTEREYDDKTITLVAKVRDKKIGIIVDRVSEVIAFKKDDINDAPQIEQIPGEYLIGIGQKDKRFVFLLKLKEIFKPEEAA